MLGTRPARRRERRPQNESAEHWRLKRLCRYVAWATGCWASAPEFTLIFSGHEPGGRNTVDMLAVGKVATVKERLNPGDPGYSDWQWATNVENQHYLGLIAFECKATPRPARRDGRHGRAQALLRGPRIAKAGGPAAGPKACGGNHDGRTERHRRPLEQQDRSRCAQTEGGDDSHVVLHAGRSSSARVDPSATQYGGVQHELCGEVADMNAIYEPTGAAREKGGEDHA